MIGRDQWIETAARAMYENWHTGAWENEADHDQPYYTKSAIAALDAVLPQIEAAVRAEYEETPPIPAAITRSFNAGAKAGRAEVLAEVHGAVTWVGTASGVGDEWFAALKAVNEAVDAVAGRELGASS